MLHRLQNRWQKEGYSGLPSFPGKYTWKACLDNIGYVRKPRKQSLGEWLSENEEVLRLDKYHRKLNAVVAGELLQLFKSQNGIGWTAIRKLPTTGGYLETDLYDWHPTLDNETESVWQVCPENSDSQSTINRTLAGGAAPPAQPKRRRHPGTENLSSHSERGYSLPLC